MSAPTNVTAVADARGGAVALSWTVPDLPPPVEVRILRREDGPPPLTDDVTTSPDVVYADSTPPGAAGHFLDTGLKSEITYYYAIVASAAGARPFPAYVSVMTTAPYRIADHLYRNLPELYRAHDTVTSPALRDATDAGKGQLLRLIEMFGSQFDLLRSHADGMQSFFDPNRIDGRLLPLLAQWIGWQTNHSATLGLQRNEVRFAPYSYATTGLAANVRASINRLVPWDVRIKEFAHNIFLSNRPEELAIYELERRGGPWQPAGNVSFDVAYDGRLSALTAADGRTWLFYHARQSASGIGPDRWQLWCKVHDDGGWLPAHRLTNDAAVNKHPTALQLKDGSVLLFWSTLDSRSPGRPTPQLAVHRLAVGRPASNARLESTGTAPFALADGDVLKVKIGEMELPDITLRAEQFVTIGQATATEVAAILNSELPEVDVTAIADGKLVFATRTVGTASRLEFKSSTVASKLGLDIAPPSVGKDAASAELTSSRAEPFALANHDTLVITVDNDIARQVEFLASQTSAAQIAAAINEVVPGLAQSAAGRILLRSPRPGAGSFVSVDVTTSSAAPKLGFGTPPPAALAVDEAEPSAAMDAAENVWLFWSSRRNGPWQIWYSRFDGSTWGAPKALTSPELADREPFVVIGGPAGAGRIWVFWSRQKNTGVWNIFFRTTLQLDFNTLSDANWTEVEMTSPTATFDNREPAALLSGAGSVELYFASNRSDGWKIWTRAITPTSQGADTAISAGAVTHRAPLPLDAGNGARRLFFRANESIVYESNLYPGSITIDGRYGGSTTVDTRNTARKDQRGGFQDIGHYTYDTPKASAKEEAKRLYSRDTVGVFLTPSTTEAQLIKSNRALIAGALLRVLPIQVRAVLMPADD